MQDDAPAREERDRGLREMVPAIDRWAAAQLGDKRERRRLRWHYLLSGYRKEPLPAHRGPVESPSPGRTGICCSGGGIRSAAFNLGALQTLLDAGRLQTADYLAAVSGGSYIAAAFAMVAKTGDDGCSDDSDPKLIREQPPFAPGSPEEQYLRNRSAYLAPDAKARLYLVYRILLGMLVNVVFVVLPLFGATVLLGVLVYRHSFPTLVTCTPHSDVACTSPGAFSSDSVSLPLLYWLIPVALAVASALLGLTVMLLPPRSEAVNRGLQIWSTRLLIGAALFGLLTVALPELVALLHAHGAGSGTETGAKPASDNRVAAIGVAGLIAGVIAALREVFADASKAVGAFAKLRARVRLFVVYTVAAVLGPLLVYAVVVFSMLLALANADSASHRAVLLAAALAALALFAAMYRLTDITALSLHPFYRRRLCTAFALKRIRPTPPLPDRARAGQEQAGEIRKGGDAPIAADEQQFERGIAVERDYDKLVRLSETGLDPRKWPTLIVCAAANISEPGATPPGRPITSFTFSSSTIGGPLVGATSTRRVEELFGDLRRGGGDLTLPAAVAMSGAAIAPSMGKSAPRAVTFLLALANLRLGVWVPNPRWVAGCTGAWRRRPTPIHLILELLGRNRVDSRYLFVTDGGHYENLGLVELLRRGCTRIYCFDASGGECEALGDAVALARSELGVQIDINPAPLMPGSAPTRNRHTHEVDGAKGEAGPGRSSDEDALAAQIAIAAEFTYRDGIKGTLVYARNVMTAGAPWDVRAHHDVDPSFPHDSTVDQLYTDQKFESYRALGAQAGRRSLALMEPPPTQATVPSDPAPSSARP